VNAEGGTTLVKFHWKPRLGVHSLTWEEAQLLGGMDPDFHRRDLYDAIESGAYPQYELGVQAFEDTPDQTFEGIDLLDPTKLVPEELAPVQPLGLLTLTGTPTNFFAEAEQVAFHVGNLVPGIDVTDDPLLQVRLFSYVDTQLTRLGGPNFNQLPVNRPHAPVNDMLRDGMHQTAVHGGVAPYRPNSLDGGCPFVAGDPESAFLDVPQAVAAGSKVRELSASFDDHFSQARLFWLSMSPAEQDHIVQAYTFELGKCYDETIRRRQLLALAQVDGELAAEVADGLGLPAPEPDVAATDVAPSPALSQVGGTWPVEGRTVAVVVDATSNPATVATLTDALRAESLVPLLLAPTGGRVWADRDLPAHRTLLTSRSVEFDAVVVTALLPPAADARQTRDAKAGAGSSAAVDPRLTLLVDEAFRHGKAIGVVGDASMAAALGLADDEAGVTVGDAARVAAATVEGLEQHRAWDRFTPTR
jgi:catalase